MRWVRTAWWVRLWLIAVLALPALHVAAVGDQRAPAGGPGVPARGRFSAVFHSPWEVRSFSTGRRQPMVEWDHEGAGLWSRRAEFGIDGTFKYEQRDAVVFRGVVQEIVVARASGAYVVSQAAVTLRGTMIPPPETTGAPSEARPFLEEWRLIGQAGEPGMAIWGGGTLLTAQAQAPVASHDGVPPDGLYHQEHLLRWADGEGGEPRPGRQLLGFESGWLVLDDPMQEVGRGGFGKYTLGREEATLLEGNWQGSVTRHHGGSWRVVAGVVELLPARVKPGAEQRVAAPSSLLLEGTGASRLLRAGERVYRPHVPPPR